jgi:hypothetical protein
LLGVLTLEVADGGISAYILQRQMSDP